MTSQIVSTTIDEDFPIAGQDNDSQGFRDNFNIIKDGLATAASEITVLQTSTAKLDEANDFNGTVIANAQTNRLYGTVYPTTTTSGTTAVSFDNGEYQIITLDRNSTLRFENWPDPGSNVYSKIRVAFKTDGTGDYTVNFITQGGTLTPVQGAADTYTTGTDVDVVQIVEAWTADNGATVFLSLVGDFATSATIADISSIGNVDISVPVTGQVLKYNGTNWVNGDDLDTKYYTGSQDLADAGIVDLGKSVSWFSTSTEETTSLAAGVEGQIKTFVMYGTAGDMVIVVTNPGWGGIGNITFSSVGQGCTLQYINNKWFCIGNNGAAFA